MLFQSKGESMRNHLRCLFVLTIACAFTGSVLAQEKKPADKPAEKPATKPADKPAAGQPSPEEMKMMEVWKQAAKPGEFHAKLKPLTGNWTMVTRFRMSPDQPWEQSTGKAEYKWILGDRILVQTVKGDPGGAMDDMMGYPFEGHGMTGYDNATKKYWNIWADNMGTGIMTSTGTVDGSGKTFTSTAEYDDPNFGHKSVKTVLKIAGDDKAVFEMYDKGPDGKEFMGLEVTYTRQK
jgi:hypothetical protein